MLEIVFENARFIAVDKPAGWLTVPARMGTAETRTILSQKLADETGRVWPVHRLDQTVSGLLLFARDPDSHRAACGCFEQRQIHKIYEALTETKDVVPFLDQCFEWHSKLLRGKKRAYESDQGKPSVTLARLTGIDGAFLRWQLRPLTGRSHQLRYELAKAGFPILGDSLYGSTQAYREGAIALRSVCLDFSDCPMATEMGLPPKIEVSGL